MSKPKVLNKRLQVSNKKLDTLLNLTREINQNRSVDYLLEKFNNILISELKISRFCFFMFIGSHWECVLSHNCNKKQIDDIDVENDFSDLKDISIISSLLKSEIADFNIVISIIHDDEPLGYIVIGDTNPLEPGVSPTIKHAKYIQALGNLIFVAIDNNRLMQKTAEQATITRELEFASDIQNMLIPNKDTLPKVDGVNIDFYYRPHSQVGGDYFDVIKLHQNYIGFCIADVSGKGVPAAMLMSNFQAALRAVFTKDITLKKLIHKLNDHVNRVANGERFVTIFIGRYNISDHVLEYVNAGHVPPILFDINSCSYVPLKNGCLGLGMNNEIPFVNKGLVEIKRGCKLISFTDGLFEQESDKGIVTNTDLIINSICNSESISKNIDVLRQEIEKGIVSGNFFDDVSILALEFN